MSSYAADHDLPRSYARASCGALRSGETGSPSARDSAMKFAAKPQPAQAVRQDRSWRTSKKHSSIADVVEGAILKRKESPFGCRPSHTTKLTRSYDQTVPLKRHVARFAQSALFLPFFAASNATYSMKLHLFIDSENSRCSRHRLCGICPHRSQREIPTHAQDAGFLQLCAQAGRCFRRF